MAEQCGLDTESQISKKDLTGPTPFEKWGVSLFSIHTHMIPTDWNANGITSACSSSLPRESPTKKVSFHPLILLGNEHRERSEPERLQQGSGPGPDPALRCFRGRGFGGRKLDWGPSYTIWQGVSRGVSSRSKGQGFAPIRAFGLELKKGDSLNSMDTTLHPGFETNASSCTGSPQTGLGVLKLPPFGRVFGSFVTVQPSP